MRADWPEQKKTENAHDTAVHLHNNKMVADAYSMHIVSCPLQANICLMIAKGLVFKRLFLTRHTSSNEPSWSLFFFVAMLSDYTPERALTCQSFQEGVNI